MKMSSAGVSTLTAGAYGIVAASSGLGCTASMLVNVPSLCRMGHHIVWHGDKATHGPRIAHDWKKNKADGVPALNSKSRIALCDVQGAFEAAAFVGNFFPQLENGIEQSLGAGRASGNVDVHGDHLVHSLHDGVVVEDAAGSRASAHGNHPLGLRHLRVKLFDH